MAGEALPNCPYCGCPPQVFHGSHGGEMGETVECDRNGCPQPDHGEPAWHYTTWPAAVERWKNYVAAALAATS